MLMIHVNEKLLVDFCRHWKVAELSIFGSSLTERFRPESDVDLLVEFLPNTEIGFFELAEMQEQLEDMFGRSVDLVIKRGLKPVIRDSVLSSSQVLYAAA